ncbi:hypothetical protein VdG1_03011 [Verticillium dahliae VDG1]|nr:hypothetical protein VdG1_03011 [Verticillium dahliae VDG1]
MGSQIDSQDEFTVLVTGFGPFKAAYPVNPSWEIARRLPSHLPATSVPAAAADADPSTAPALPLPPVRILVHPEAIRVNYQVVRGLEAVGRGTELATGLVRALVESEVQSRRSADIRKEDKIAVELRV